MFKKRNSVIGILLSLALLLAACQTGAQVRLVSIDAPVRTTLRVSETLNLTAKVDGTNNPSELVNWESEQPTVASVGSSGQVTALATGTATIKATSVEDSSKFATLVLTIEEEPSGAIILTFDDVYVAEWLSAHESLKQYDWKATFFITRFFSFDAQAIEGLKVLQSEGHEIGAHGVNHEDIVAFSEESSIQDYISQQIMPDKLAMESNGLSINTFAYPFGTRNEETDAALLQIFSSVRGTTYGEQNFASAQYYAPNAGLVFGLGLDESYQNSTEYILDMLAYAKENDKTVVFYGHKIVPEADGEDYTTSLARLETVVKYAAENNMEFMTMDEIPTANQ